MEGSEHTVDGGRLPAEMHVVTFKSCYLTQEAALKEQDGCATLVYFFKLQDAPNPAFQPIVDALLDIQKAGSSKKITPTVITSLVRKFESDFFLYWGSVSTTSCTHYLMWLICRIPIAVNVEQIDALRFIFDENGEQLTRNFRQVQSTQERTVLHVNPSPSKYSTLLQVPNSVTQIYRCEVIYNKNLTSDSDSKTNSLILKLSLEDEQRKKRKKIKKYKMLNNLQKYIYEY
ncbi:hypothetical protein NQ314_011602 [Rhamnusium bicolor]|uniref:Alpha-carbonic anhydrase domain-containing protein n=1 Tax=Rhamnusium bicolor TaxID=1586634 RepID=A0AAV8XH17_9CUCU|nr:hypothetical protein NQ314_011602 [Rhamnusium bicolor]